MNLKATILVVLTTAGLIACSSSSNLDYFDSRVLPDLEVPPDLTQVDVDKSFELPTAIFSGSPIFTVVDNSCTLQAWHGLAVTVYREKQPVRHKVSIE